MMLGKFSKRKVCPVGAVSKIITSYCMSSTDLINLESYFINSAKLMASSIPGTALTSSDSNDLVP